MKNHIILNLAAMAAALVFAASCGKENPETVGFSEPLTKAEEGINSATNQFGFNVFHALYEKDQVLFSPLSASLALSMTATGANGNTASQMISTLGFEGYTMDEVNGYFKKMVAALLTIDPNTAFEIANSLWISERANARKDFINECKKYYASEVFPADFGSQETIDKVNKWCSDKTHGKIPSILDGPNPNMVMALMNALYFKGTWKNAFQSDIFPGDFRTISGTVKSVDMMYQQSELPYAEYDGFRMVELPYGNGAFSMKVILPKEKEDFAKAVKRFDAKTLDKLRGKATTNLVNVIMPKFTFEYKADLNDILIALGMEDAFDGGKADFSKMSHDDLFISFVKQKTFIDVNESGTEAAAVTVVAMDKNAPMDPPKTIDFTADRPFLFVIQENSTGAVLFIGQKVS